MAVEIPRTSVSSEPFSIPQSRGRLCLPERLLLQAGLTWPRSRSPSHCLFVLQTNRPWCLPSASGRPLQAGLESRGRNGSHTQPATPDRGEGRGCARPLMQLLAEGLWRPCPPLELSTWSNVAEGCGEECSAAGGPWGGVFSGLPGLPAPTLHTHLGTNWRQGVRSEDLEDRAPCRCPGCGGVWECQGPCTLSPEAGRRGRCSEVLPCLPLPIQGEEV